MLPGAWCPACYLSLETEAKELPSPQVAKVLVSGANAPALNSPCPAGADSCDRDRFWKALDILALYFCQLCALQCGLVADNNWTAFKAGKVL